MDHKRRRTTKEITTCAVFAALAMVFSYVESFIPIPYPFPGMKLGFSNIAIIAVLYMFTAKDAFVVNVVRIILSGLLFGNVNTFIFSIAGGMASLAVMALLKKLDIFHLMVVSAIGGVVHNVVQVIIAGFILFTPVIFYMMPAFMVFGAVTGIMCGALAKSFLKRVEYIN